MAGEKYSLYTILLLLLAGSILINTAIGKSLLAETKKTGSLKPVEISNYEGKHLSSINDFRENSIKGPQYGVSLLSSLLRASGDTNGSSGLPG